MSENTGKLKKSDRVTGDVTFDLSLLSLSDRARLAAMADMDGDQGVRSLVLGILGDTEKTREPRRKPREVPSSWSVVHVLDRLEEAYEVLSHLPMVTRPKQFGNGMPTVLQEQRFSLLDQIEMEESGDLELMRDDRNRVRLSVTAAQISRMDQAFRWPVDFLMPYPEMAKAVCLKAFWTVSKVDIAKRCETRGINRKFFNRQWQHALAVIATQLVMRKVPVS